MTAWNSSIANTSYTTPANVTALSLLPNPNLGHETCNCLNAQLMHKLLFHLETRHLKDRFKINAKMERTAISTDPPVIKNLRHRGLTPYSSSVTVEWDIDVKVDGFSVRSYMDGQEPRESITKNPIFKIDIQPACSYNIEVACIIQGRNGRYSKVLHFTTAPKGPYDLEVTPGICSPSTSLTVKYQDDDRDGKKYHILVESPDHKVEEKTTEKLAETITKLQPGVFYDIRVTGSKNGVKGKPCILEGIATFPGQVQELRHGHGTYPTSQAIVWNPIPGVPAYIIKHRRLDKSYKTQETDDTEMTLQNLDSGQEYTVSVAAKNSSGTGQFSEPLHFTTRMQPPAHITVVPDKDDPSSAVHIKIDDQDTHSDRQYGILVKPISDGQRIKDINETIDRNQCIIRNLVPGTQYIAYVWSLVPDAPDRNSIRVRSGEFWTAPKPVTGINCSKDSPTSVLVTWGLSAGAVSYIVSVKRDGGEPEMKSTEKCWMYLKDLHLHSKYKLTVSARNSGGESRESSTVPFETALHTPKAIVVEACKHNSTKAIIVHVTEPDVPAQRYKLKVISLKATDQPVVQEIHVSRQEATTGKTVEGLDPGESYQVSVCSAHNRKDLCSEEVFSDVIQTRLPPLRVEHFKLANYKYKFTWNPLNDAINYQLKWRVEDDEEWDTDTVHATEKILRDLKPGCNFEAKVTAYNDAGKGDSSQIIRFTTVPGTPTDIQYDIATTRKVTITCKEVDGATQYRFDILGKPYYSHEPQLTFEHDAETTTIGATVSARNSTGFGPQSKKLEFRQTLLRVQKKFIQMAKNKIAKEQFIVPIFTDVSTNDTHYGFGTQDFNIGSGETVLIIGGHFVGKTACCSYYLQTLKEDELGIFLDMEDYQQKSDLSIETLLKSAIIDISNEEMAFLFGWTEKHSNKVVIVIDNFSLPKAFNRKKVDSNTQYLLFSLARLNREIFPDSSILCATSQDHLQQLIEPTMTLRIDEFDSDAIKSMKLEILGEDLWLPTHQEYFCINPSYCTAILHLQKVLDKTIDMDSYASICAKALTESIRRYPEVKQQKILKEIWAEINSVPNKLRARKIDPSKRQKRPKSSSSSLNPDDLGTLDTASINTLDMQDFDMRHSCTSLQDNIIIALHFAFVRDLDSFKEYFQKKRIVLGYTAKIFILACGFLREDTAELLLQLFEKVDQSFKTNRKDVKKLMNDKLKAVYKSISDNISDIQKQLMVDSQVLLDWCDIITEVNYNDIWKKNPIKTDKKCFNEQTESDQVFRFLRSMRRPAFQFIKHPDDLSGDIKRKISDAQKENLNLSAPNYFNRSLRGTLQRSLRTPHAPYGANTPRKHSGNGDDVFDRERSSSTPERPVDGSILDENALTSSSTTPVDDAENDEVRHDDQNEEIKSGKENLV